MEVPVEMLERQGGVSSINLKIRILYDKSYISNFGKAD